MAIDFALLGLGLITALAAAALLWRKIPLLLQVPTHLIDQSFVTRPSRVKYGADRVVEFFRTHEYRDLYYRAVLAILRRLRLWFLRLERMAFQTLESLEQRNRNWSRERVQYWSTLKQWKAEARQNGTPSVPADVGSPVDTANDGTGVE